jgi:hypothetical protein
MFRYQLPRGRTGRSLAGPIRNPPRLIAREQQTITVVVINRGHYEAAMKLSLFILGVFAAVACAERPAEAQDYPWFPVGPDNAANKDWVILLETSTIVGPSPDKLRVARSTLEKKIVKKYNILLRARYFLDVEGYDPRIHAVYFCPQLYKYDADKALVPLEGEEIGKLIAQALASGVKPRRPWYEPSEKLPDQPIINTPKEDFETLVVEMPTARSASGKKPLMVAANRVPNVLAIAPTP